MKIIDQWFVQVEGNTEILYQTPFGFFISSVDMGVNGAVTVYLSLVPDEAKKLIYQSDPLHPEFTP